jgi:hypothetical protein
MGWWGYDIMDGDDPSDCQGAIRSLLDLNWDDDTPITAQMLFDNTDEIVALCAKRQSGHYDYAYQAWGWMLLEAKATALSGEHRALILNDIDTDLNDLPEQGWQDPGGRLHCLQKFRARMEVIGTGKVVDMHALHLTRAENRVQKAMQDAFGASNLSDPSIVQKAVASLLEALREGESLVDWGVAVQATVNVGKAVAEATAAGVPLDRVLVAVRPHVGA